MRNKTTNLSKYKVNKIHNVFRWYMIFPNIYDFFQTFMTLPLTFVLFHEAKNILWLAINRDFSGFFGQEVWTIFQELFLNL